MPSSIAVRAIGPSSVAGHSRTTVVPARSFSAAAHFTAGEVFADRYLLLDRLSSHVMSNVWRVLDQEQQRQAILKTSQLAQLKGLIATEAEVLKMDLHPSFPRLFETGDRDEVLYFTMEEIAGVELSALIRDRKELPLYQVLDIASQVLAGLGALHARDLVHRDVKPDNILISDRTVRLIDFGLAFPAGASDHYVKGTPAYMPREQFLNETLYPRTDLYALGIMLYEMLTKFNPMQSNTPRECYEKQLFKEMPALALENILFRFRPSDHSTLKDQLATLHHRLQAIIAYLTEKDAAARVQQAATVSADLAELRTLAEQLSPYEGLV